jgi:hypothetical protein
LKEIQIYKPLQKTVGRNNLVVVRAGVNSLHPLWLTGTEQNRNWDLLVSCYEPCPFTENQAEGLLLHFGNKLCAVKYYWEQGWFQDYDYVWFPDPDLEIKGQDINLLFSSMKIFDLQLAQPSLSADSYTSHHITLQVKNAIIRYTTFVEVMQPCFSISALDVCAPSFDSNRFMWGIDHVWPRLLGYPSKKIAIIDAISARHIQPVGSSYDLQEAYREMFDTLARYNVAVRMEVLDTIFR